MACRMQSLLVFFFLIFESVLLSNPVFCQDVQGSKDHPLIGRYPNSVIRNYETKDYDEYYLPLGSIPAFGVQKGKYKLVEGKVTKIRYAVPPDPTPRSTLEVLRNYQMSLQKAGFETLFSCTDQQCGEAAWQLFHIPDPTSQRLFSAALSRPEGEVHVCVYVGESRSSKGTLLAALTIVEGKPMETGLISVDADAMSKEIAAAVERANKAFMESLWGGGLISDDGTFGDLTRNTNQYSPNEVRKLLAEYEALAATLPQPLKSRALETINKLRKGFHELPCTKKQNIGIAHPLPKGFSSFQSRKNQKT